MVVEAVDIWDRSLAEWAGATHWPLPLLLFLPLLLELLCGYVLSMLAQDFKLLLAAAMRGVRWLRSCLGVASKELALSNYRIEGGCLGHRWGTAVELNGTFSLGCLSGLGLLRVLVLLLVAYQRRIAYNSLVRPFVLSRRHRWHFSFGS